VEITKSVNRYTGATLEGENAFRRLHEDGGISFMVCEGANLV
jgi:hypothetical protein